MDKKEAIIKHLQERQQQLEALIAHLEYQGESNPQYHQLDKCNSEYQTVINQLKKLQK